MTMTPPWSNPSTEMLLILLCRAASDTVGVFARSVAFLSIQ